MFLSLSRLVRIIVRQEEFQFNKHLLDNACRSNHSEWLESIDITRIPLKSINFELLEEKNTKIDLKDIDGNDVVLCGRTRIMLSRSFELIIEQINAKPIASRTDVITYLSSQTPSQGDRQSSDDSFTNGTQSFFIK